MPEPRRTIESELPSQPAANARSPNRKPRKRRPFRLWEQAQLKQVFLRAYRASGDLHRSAEFVGKKAPTVKEWIKKDEVFGAAYRDLRTNWETLKSDTLEDLDIKAIGVVEAALNSDDERLKTDVAMKLLKSHGHMADRSRVEHTGPGGGDPVVIHTVVVEPPEIIEGDMKELPDGE